MQSYCSHSEQPILKEICAYGCYDEDCMDEPRKDGHELLVVGINFLNGEYVNAGDQLLLNVNVENNGRRDMKYVRITATIMELGLRSSIGRFRVDRSETISKLLLMDIPDWVPSGDYTIRFTISNDEVRRVVHREITVL